MKKAVGRTHGQLVHGRRVRRLAVALAELTEPGWRIADVGCGDGRVGALVQALATDVVIEGYERLPRADTAIPVHAFDGERIPVADGAVDAVMLVDVLHHTDDPGVLLAEAARVARHAVLLKDHRTARPLALPTLRLMDWVGNRAHGVPLPYNYWSEERWRAAWQEHELTVEAFRTRLGLYPWPADWLFESGLHFVARLRPATADA
jgi:SAM-dependent methyltransferase